MRSFLVGFALCSILLIDVNPVAAAAASDQHDYVEESVCKYDKVKVNEYTKLFKQGHRLSGILLVFRFTKL